MAFFAIMNPFVNIPIFVQLTEGLDEHKGIKLTFNI
jgi:small neutral amino acid transporter SnatA (MarC family)